MEGKKTKSAFDRRNCDPERLVDGGVWHVLDHDRGDGYPAGSLSRLSIRGRAAEERFQRRAIVGDDEGALKKLTGTLRQRLAGGGVSDAKPALEPVGVERPQRDAGLDDRDRQR